MVIQIQPSAHGPHIWWPAVMWYQGVFFIDFFRQEYPSESRDGIRHPRDFNTYLFTEVRS